MARHIATARQPRKILLVLTDGAPNNAPAAQVCIRAMVDHGIEVMGIGIGTMAVQDLFPDYRVINELGELALSFNLFVDTWSLVGGRN